MRRASSENVKINIVCTYCGMEHCKRLGWFRDHSSLSCGGCGYEIALRNEQLRAARASGALAGQHERSSL